MRTLKHTITGLSTTIKIKLKMIVSILLIFLFIVPVESSGQENLYQFRKFPQNITPPADFTFVPKKPGHYSAQDWQAAIDSTWGPGLPTQTKLNLFDEACNKLDAEYAAFQNLNVNWDSLYTLYHTEINSGVSRGRFAAIMNHLSLALHELHTGIIDAPVMYTPPAPGVPLFYVGSNLANTSHFGATLTPLPDSTALVIKSTINHPIGLEPGDIVLGYDGILWKNLYKALLNAQLPLHTLWGMVAVASDLNSFTHMVLSDAGMNWHLFDTLDVVKYSTGDTLHFPTSSLAGQSEFIWGNEQLAIPGVPWVYQGTANLMDPDDFGDAISWGIVDGTNIGYIYALAWTRNVTTPGFNVSQQFYDAVDSLMNIYNTDGLIIDIRQNHGGSWQYQQGFSLLYNHTFTLFGLDKRGSDPNNHYQMVPNNTWNSYLITSGDPNTIYDRPIAVLTGPAAVSGGDMSILTLKYHPMTRLFGKQTNGAFSTISFPINLGGIPDWVLHYTFSNCYLLSDPGNYLAHIGFMPDEEVWFTPEDVANGDDTVVKAAMAWINSMIHIYNISKPPSFVQDTLTITANVANPNNHNINPAIIINTLDSVFVDSLPLFDDGNHGDSLAGDGLYGTFLNPLSLEDIFTISGSVTDLDSSNYHILPRVARFTTIGPVEYDSVIIYDGYSIGPFYNVPIDITITNKGSITTAKNVRVDLIIDHPNVVGINNTSQVIGDIAAGQTITCPDSFIIRMRDPAPVENIVLNFNFYSNNFLYWQDIDSIVLGLQKVDKYLPLTYSLSQNYPNPFNPITTIEFSIPKTEYVTLKIYNILGQEVSELVAKRLTPGNYKYTWDASGFASGVYYYKIQAGDPSTGSGYRYVQTKKLLLLK